MSFHSLYAAFEIHPSAKGASTHIGHMIDALASSISPVLVCTLQGEEINNNDPRIGYRFFGEQVEHYLDRGSRYSASLRDILKATRPFEFAPYRAIWSGLPVLESGKSWMNIFEVNGFPSIELPYRYPDLGKETLRKIKELEMHCLLRSDLIICPSLTIKNFIVSLGIEESRIRVIPNGAEPPAVTVPVPGLPENFILYFGALQLWQGIDTLIKAFRLVSDIKDTHLVICSSQREKFSKPYIKLAEDCGVIDRIQWHHQLDKERLGYVIDRSLFTVAPLKETSRNILQGCSPLKIFESMVQARAVVASDLPVVREILTRGYDGHLVRPDRPSELSRGMLKLLDDPDYAARLGRNAMDTVNAGYSWTTLKNRLIQLYRHHKLFAA